MHSTDCINCYSNYITVTYIAMYVVMDMAKHIKCFSYVVSKVCTYIDEIHERTVILYI